MMPLVPLSFYVAFKVRRKYAERQVQQKNKEKVESGRVSKGGSVSSVESSDVQLSPLYASQQEENVLK